MLLPGALASNSASAATLQTKLDVFGSNSIRIRVAAPGQQITEPLISPLVATPPQPSLVHLVHPKNKIGTWHGAYFFLDPCVWAQGSQIYCDACMQMPPVEYASQCTDTLM